MHGWRTKWRLVRWIPVGIVALPVLCVAGCYLLIDWNSRPVCHKLAYISFRMWMGDRGTNVFPNILGRSLDSLREVREEMSSSILEEKYHYVPGLQEGDPGDLVLMYLKQPTRWIWHGQPRTILARKGWIVVPADFTDRHRQSGPGEVSEWVSTSEFKRRLQAALDFVRTNERPHWQTVVMEHSEFLKTVVE